MIHHTMARTLQLVILCLLCPSVLAFPTGEAAQRAFASDTPRKDARVLILGGGMAGITAARTLHDQGIDEFIIVEARHELGGRMMSQHLRRTWAAVHCRGRRELGARHAKTWRCCESGMDVWTEHTVWGHTTKLTESASVAMYDETGPVDFSDVFNQSVEDFDRLIASAGERVPKGLVDASARTGYSLTGARPHTHHEMASEYFQNNNSTFTGFSEDNLLSVDQRGFKTILHSEAEAFLSPEQLRFNSTVSRIRYSANGVEVALDDGRELTADYAICTFSLGVLQHSSVAFEPQLPMWKREAIHSMTMGVYTKLFLQFPHKFWFDTEAALYADRERGRYPIWQSLDHPKFLPGSGILFGTVTGAFSRRIESLPRRQVLDEILSVLASMFPNITIPEPLDFHFHPWSADPLFRGSYANWPPSFLPEHHANLRADLDGKVWFAGEYTSRLYFGYLQGAYFEGRDIAVEVAECIRGGGCLGLEHVEQVKNANPY
ncbi:hypothetical protein NM688_g8196 [Phlebia brevispora]|uniref:Uncharacterized protein n=1 Tax=Phlebia brevispora TaxID=194682 RepID=A0ACC1RW17_9APHY|nr:hypothetical protein NM688_g8196 [Phlebia brevispora]